MIEHTKINDKDVYVMPSKSTKNKHVIHLTLNKYFCSCPKKVWNTETCRHIKILEYYLKYEPDYIIEMSDSKRDMIIEEMF